MGNVAIATINRPNFWWWTYHGAWHCCTNITSIHGNPQRPLHKPWRQRNARPRRRHRAGWTRSRLVGCHALSAGSPMRTINNAFNYVKLKEGMYHLQRTISTIEKKKTAITRTWTIEIDRSDRCSTYHSYVCSLWRVFHIPSGVIKHGKSPRVEVSS